MLHECAALAGWHEDEDGVRLGIGGALRERREVGLASGTLIASAISPPAAKRH
jgi:hypothetical protein